MVALTIMLVGTGLLLENYPNSTLRLTLLNNTHISALLIREAQIRGSAVDSSATVSNSVGGYGVFINLATSSQAILFGDSIKFLESSHPGLKNKFGFDIGDGLYDEAVSLDKVKSTLKFKEGFTFKKLCVASSTASEGITNGYLCSTVNTVPIRTLTISFNRPSQIAHMYINGNSANDFAGACIQLYSPKSPEVGHIRSIKVSHSGMVTTSMNPCN